MGFFFFIFPFLLHLSPPHVDQIAGSDLCPINPFLKSLWVAIKLYHLHINAARELAVEHSMRR